MEPATKKLCLEKVSNHVPESEASELEEFNFKNFKMKRILNNMEDRCCVFVEGIFDGSSEKAVISLQKLAFSEDKLKETFLSITNSKTLFKNDIYCNQIATLPSDLNKIKVNTIYPANEKLIKKYERQASSFIDETPELYESVTLPFIETLSFSKQWIYNILEHKKEADRIVCEDLDPDVGFVMVPDMHWTGEQMENLYLQAIVRKRDIRSIRDLRGEHLPLLRNIYDKCTKRIEEKYGLARSKLRIYFHYQPSFYHLHVHFTALSFEAPGTWVGKAHLLKDVISNLEIDADFYKKANLSFSLKDNHPLAMLFNSEANGTSSPEG